ncbi:MAG: helix-turn-helix transcriptional regulator, partial [Lachnospiraceae bacterium]
MNFASVLKDLREAKHITQEDLALYLKVSRPTIAGYETKSRQPDFEKLLKMSKYFNVSVDYLLTGQEDSPLTPCTTLPQEISERHLDHHILSLYQKLSFHSKQEIFEYMKL